VRDGQIAALARLRATRDSEAVDAALADVAKAAETLTENLLVPMREALRRNATVGEVCNTLRGVFGMHRPSDPF